MVLVGYALLAVSCFANDQDCDSKAVDNVVYASRAECEWELQNKSFYYSNVQLVCAEVKRPSRDDR